MKNYLPYFDKKINIDEIMWAMKDLNRVNNKGLRCEAYLLKKLMEKSVELVAHRYKTKLFEVDLVVLSPKNKLHLIEVKSLSHSNWIENRVSKFQSKRLKNALIHFQSLVEIDVQLDLALVHKNNKINYIENFLV